MGSRRFKQFLLSIPSYILTCLFCIHTYVASAVAPAIGSPIHSSTLDKIKERLKVIYGPSPDSDEPHCYIQLALVKDGIISRNDEKLNEITKLTLQGQVDEIAQMKESLNGIKDIFYYKDSTCPRIILIIGAPGD